MTCYPYGFNKKIDVANAQCGYSLSREFTGDAVNQAKEFTRLPFHIVEETTEFEPQAFMQMQYSSIDKSSYHPAIFPTPSDVLKAINNPTITVEDGRSLLLQTLISENYGNF